VRRKYLGDSYDLVKRVWANTLREIGPLYAHPRFVPAELRDQYTAVTSIPILDLDALPEHGYGLLFDPHTGIPLPDEGMRGATSSHASLTFIVEAIESLRAGYAVCFDLSHHRSHQLTVAGQRDRKRTFLQERGMGSFYYVSHAPFLFIAPGGASLAAVQERLLALGIPPERFEPGDASVKAANMANQARASGRR
jgi:hypothetical protein